MTVKELIEELQKLPKDMQVRTYEEGSMYDCGIATVKKDFNSRVNIVVILKVGSGY